MSSGCKGNLYGFGEEYSVRKCVCLCIRVLTTVHSEKKCIKHYRMLSLPCTGRLAPAPVPVSKQFAAKCKCELL